MQRQTILPQTANDQKTSIRRPAPKAFTDNRMIENGLDDSRSVKADAQPE